jgi:hypothetical protein
MGDVIRPEAWARPEASAELEHKRRVSAERWPLYYATRLARKPRGEPPDGGKAA